MSYEKLGFEKGQILKAEHLNHMEDGIASSGGAYIEYYTGEIIAYEDGKTVELKDISRQTLVDGYYSMEVAVRLHNDTNSNDIAEYSWFISDKNGYTSVFNNGPRYYSNAKQDCYGHYGNKKFPVARLNCHAVSENITIQFDDSDDNCISISNIQFLYVRLYPKV